MCYEFAKIFTAMLVAGYTGFLHCMFISRY